MNKNFWYGTGLGTLCAVIWGGQAVVSRRSVFDGLTATDVTVLRFLVAGLVLLPLALRRRPLLFGSVRWWHGVALAALAGAPYSLVLVGGVAFTPALHSAVITQGLTPVMATLMVLAVTGERPRAARLVGLGLIIAGVAVFAWAGLSAARDGAWRGQLLFVLAAAMWAGFGLLTKRWQVEPVVATMIIGVLSLVGMPLWIWMFPMHLGHATAGAVVLQAGYQGLLVGIVSLVLYTRTIALLGPVSAALFLPLVPAVACLVGALALGERPTAFELAGMTSVVVGIALALRPEPA